MIEAISLIIYSDFGFFKKPDVNAGGTYLTYEFIPKATILGIFGSVLGLGGYRDTGKRPEFYEKLKDLRVGVQPLEIRTRSYPPHSSKDFMSLKEPFQKTFVRYNNYHGYGSYERGGIGIKKEQVLLSPAYRIFLRKSKDNRRLSQIKDRLKNGISHYTPYMGKNDFPLNFIYEGGSFFHNHIEKKTVKIDTLYFDEIIKDIPPLGFLDEGMRIYNIMEDYPYKLADMQYKRKKARYSNKDIEINWGIIAKRDYEVLANDEFTVFLF